MEFIVGDLDIVQRGERGKHFSRRGNGACEVAVCGNNDPALMRRRVRGDQLVY